MPTHDLLALAKVLVSISQQIVYTQLAQPKRSALQTGEWAYNIAYMQPAVIRRSFITNSPLGTR